MIRGSPVSGATAWSADSEAVGRYRGITARTEKVESLYQHLCSLKFLLPVLAYGRTRQSCDTYARVSCVLFMKELRYVLTYQRNWLPLTSVPTTRSGCWTANSNLKKGNHKHGTPCEHTSTLKEISRVQSCHSEKDPDSTMYVGWTRPFGIRNKVPAVC